MDPSHDISSDQESAEFKAERASLWRITFGPLVWAVHFTLSYAAVAIYCAKAGGSLGAFRLAIGGLTVLALAAILWLGWRAWRQWDVVADREWENESGTGEDRHQFLGHAAFLLAGVSAIGVIYVTLPVLFIETCR